MSTYVPGTQEKDLSKIIMSLQAVGAVADTAAAKVAAWPGTTVGQIPFPATQVPSSDPNALDDYEEGTWTPTVTFATPGDLSVSYSAQNAYYTKIGRLVAINFRLITSTFTFTTASGNILINGLPFTAVNDANYRAYFPMIYQGVNKASYTALNGAVLGNGTQIQIIASGMGVSLSNVTASDTPSTGTLALGASTVYVV